MTIEATSQADLGELQQRWREGIAELISYRYIGTYAEPHGRREADGGLKIRRDLRGPVGLLAAPLGIALLAVAGVNVYPLSVVSPTRIDLELFESATDVSEVHFDGHLIREARSQYFTESRITDASDPNRLIGFGGTHWAVSRPCPEYTYVDPGPGVPDSADLPPLYEPYGARLRADGRLEVPEVRPELGRNGLHQGPFQVVSEAAARRAAEGALGTDKFWIEHFGMSIVARGHGVPLVAHPEVLHVTSASVTVRVEMRAEGDDDAICSAALCRFRRS